MSRANDLNASLNPEVHRPSGEPGMIHIYTGDGQGKTTCAVGLVTRAAGAGLTVSFIQFDKGFVEEDYYSERHSLAQLRGIEMVGTGAQRLMSNGRFRFKNTDEDFDEAARGLEIARQTIAAERHDLVVLDEIITCTMTSLLRREQVEGLLALHREHPRSEMVLTGRGAWPELIDSADLVTEMNMIRHYFERGVRLRRGIDH